MRMTNNDPKKNGGFACLKYIKYNISIALSQIFKANKQEPNL